MQLWVYSTMQLWVYPTMQLWVYPTMQLWDTIVGVFHNAIVGYNNCMSQLWVYPTAQLFNYHRRNKIKTPDVEIFKTFV